MIKLAFLNALAFTKDFTDNTGFNKCRSCIEAAQNCVMKQVVATASDQANMVFKIAAL